MTWPHRRRAAGPRRRSSLLPPPATETEALAELRDLAAANTCCQPMIGQGCYGTLTPGGHPPRRAREPGLVHGVHAVPAGDLPGPARGAAQLPDHGRRPDRPAVASASLLDEGTAAAEAMTLLRRANRRRARHVPRRRRLPAADHRVVRPAPRRSASRSWSRPRQRRSRRRRLRRARCSTPVPRGRGARPARR